MHTYTVRPACPCSMGLGGMYPSQLAVAVLHLMFCSQSAQDDTLQQELEEMARSSPDGVVHLNTELFDKFVVGKRRPYAIILFMTASHLLDKASLDLRGLRKEFGLLSKAGIARNGCHRCAAQPLITSFLSPTGAAQMLCCRMQALQSSGLASGRVVLADVEFKESKPLFHRLGVNTLPWIMHVSPTQSVGGDGVVNVKPGEVVGVASSVLVHLYGQSTPVGGCSKVNKQHCHCRWGMRTTDRPSGKRRT